MKNIFVPCTISHNPIIRVKNCKKCNEAVAMLIFKQGSFMNYDANALTEIIIKPLTKIVFGIHPNIFYGGYRRKSFVSKFFDDSVEFEYFCKTCRIGVPEFIASVMPIAESNAPDNLIADRPGLVEGRGCFITVTEFFDKDNDRGILRCNYQTSPESFDKIYSVLIN